MAIISVGEGIGPALSRTGDMLFRPFRMKRWFRLALPAALTLVGEGGFSGSYNYNAGGSGPGPGRGGGGGGGGGPSFDDALNWLRTYMWIVIGVGVVVILVMLVFYLLSRWLNSRGQFMFFDNVVQNNTEIEGPWRDFRELGNNLFKFRIWWDLIVFNVFLLIFVIALALAGRDLYQAVVRQDFTFTPLIIAAIVFLVMGNLVALLVKWVFASVLYNLAMPVMYIRRMDAWPAFKVAWRELFLPNMGACILYFLMLVVVHIVQGIWMFVGIIVFCCVTLCIGYLALIVPIAGKYPLALMTLPVLTFERAYKLHFVSQFGDAYRVHWQVAAVTGFPVILNPMPLPETPPPVPPAV